MLTVTQSRSSCWPRLTGIGQPAGHLTCRPGTAYPRILDEMVPSALHTVERYANNPVEADHGRLKARLRPMRGLKRHRDGDAVFSIPAASASGRSRPRPARPTAP
ncbi:MAG: DDE-type integrase/transposase/recombinase [Streptosporangiaceae bacterium]|jgi:transposase-like protein